MEDWRIAMTCRNRRALQNFYMFSVLYQRFALIQCLSLLVISIDSESLPKFVYICFVVLQSLFEYFYTHTKILQFLDRMNHEIQKHYRNRVEMQLSNEIIQ